MEKFVKKIVILISIPILIFLSLFIYFEPNNYFGFKKYDYEVFRNYNSSLPKLRYLNRVEGQNIILGDSRIKQADADYIEGICGDKYANLAFGGATVMDSIDIFWYAVSKKNIEKVVFQISFYVLRDECSSKAGKEGPSAMQEAVSNNAFWEIGLMNKQFPDASRTMNIIGQVVNPINYILSSEAIDEAYKNAIGTFNKPETVDNSLTREEKLYDYSQLIKGICEGYKVSRYDMDALIEVADYCRSHDIDLVFVIPPMHVSIFENVIEDLDLYDELADYKEELAEHAVIVNMEFLSAFSYRTDYEVDGFHFTGDSFNEYLNIIFGKQTDNQNVRILGPAAH